MFLRLLSWPVSAGLGRLLFGYGVCGDAAVQMELSVLAVNMERFALPECSAAPSDDPTDTRTTGLSARMTPADQVATMRVSKPQYRPTRWGSKGDQKGVRRGSEGSR
eukprot:8021201-Pyramimonas_sp.AAC.1